VRFPTISNEGRHAGRAASARLWIEKFEGNRPARDHATKSPILPRDKIAARCVSAAWVADRKYRKIGHRGQSGRFLTARQLCPRAQFSSNPLFTTPTP